MQHRAVEQDHRRHRRLAQLRGVAHDAIEHRLRVGGRARDDFEDFGGRRALAGKDVYNRGVGEMRLTPFFSSVRYT
ncbi:MAG: hypothetical protein ABL996_26380, partial [Micropepsaceae bacterium]